MAVKFRSDTIPKVTKHRISLDKFSGLDAEYNASPDITKCSYCYNVAFKNGVMTNANGIALPNLTLADGSVVSLPSVLGEGIKIKKVVLFPRFDYTDNTRDDYLLALTDVGTVYATSTANINFSLLPGVGFANHDDVSFVNYHFNNRDVVLMACTTAGKFYLYDVAQIRVMSGAPGMSSVCIYNDRVYGISATSAHTICYSGELDPTDWAQGVGHAGTISLLSEGGAIKKLLPFNGYLIIVRERCVQRLHTLSSPEVFTITDIYGTSDYIVPNTVTSIGSKFAFLAGKSLFTSDGFSVKKVFAGETALISDTKCATATFLDGVYYLSATIPQYATERIGCESGTGGVKNNALFAFDMESGDVGIARGMDISSMSPIVTGRTSAIFVCFNGSTANTFAMLDSSGSVYGNALPKFWVSESLDLGYPDMEKVLRRAHVASSNAVTLTFTAGGESRNVTFLGGAEPITKIIAGSGRRIKLTVTCVTANMHIYGITVDMDMMRRYYGN